ncbi:hypothetical protein G6F56_003769 [Rhizopus delemar]|nr:hypothetical protein G6F56_003769 [Rhizopus delemar]
MSDEEESDIGPQIPQQVLQKKRDTAERQMHEGEIIMSDEESDFGPQYLQQKDDLKQEETAVDPDDYTPELPPDLVEHRRTVQSQPGRRRAPIGPSLPSNLLMQSEPDDDMIGPDLPMNYNPEEEAKHSAIHAIEERARQSREAIEKKKEGSTKVERPEWMLAPPEVDYLKTATSSRSRQFSSKPVGAVDSTEWTETPADKERKSKETRSEKRKAEEPLPYSASDMQRKKVIEEYNMQTRPLSLLELHQQKKKKSREPKEDVTKRPFDREKDLVAPKMMNSKQKKEMLKQSSQFSDRFGHGRGSFL